MDNSNGLAKSRELSSTKSTVADAIHLIRTCSLGLGDKERHSLDLLQQWLLRQYSYALSVSPPVYIISMTTKGGLVITVADESPACVDSSGSLPRTSNSKSWQQLGLRLSRTTESD